MLQAHQRVFGALPPIRRRQVSSAPITGAASTCWQSASYLGCSPVASASLWSHKVCDSIVKPSRDITRACRGLGPVGPIEFHVGCMIHDVLWPTQRGEHAAFTRALSRRERARTTCGG